MEAPRVKLLQKHQKKVDGLIDDLTLLMDAQSHIMVNTGEDAGVVEQLRLAIRSLGQASYSLLMAMASAEGEEVVGQMKANLQRFADAAEQ